MNANNDLELCVGDMVFTKIGGPLYACVAKTTGSWTTHVGILVGRKGSEWIVAESAIPTARKTTLSRFIKRSVNGEFAIRRLKDGFTPAQVGQLLKAVDARMGRAYHTGFDLDANRTFCSKFVREVVLESAGVEVGRVETFSEMMLRNPAAPLWFWKVWFFGRIPWNHRTITPASMLESPGLVKVA